VKDSFYGEMQRVFDKFPKFHVKILLRDVNAKVGREDIFKPTVGNESLHKIISSNSSRSGGGGGCSSSSNNGVRVVVNFATFKFSQSKICSHITGSINYLDVFIWENPHSD
jgi:hypothetical protein